MHDTLTKFGYPHTGLFEHGAWRVLLRERQPTLASLVIVHSSDTVRNLGAVRPEDFAQFPEICGKIERVISNQFGASRFNYLALMMVDPHVHFHVCPRYSQPVKFANSEFVDTSWPKPVDISSHIPISAEQFEQLRTALLTAFSH